MSAKRCTAAVLLVLCLAVLWLGGCSEQRDHRREPVAKTKSKSTSSTKRLYVGHEPLTAPPVGAVPISAEPQQHEANGPYAAKKPEFDPVDVNGAIFEDWPKPQMAIVITGLQNGYLEPCGCAGLTNMKGGLMRRHTFLKTLTAADGYGWPAVLALDLGNLVRRFGWQAEQKHETSTQALKVLGYDAIGFGPDDLRLGVNPLLLAAADNEDRYVSANVALLDFDSSPTVRYRVVQRGGYKIGITAALGEEYSRKVNDDQIQIKKPVAALNEILPKLEAAQCDLLILLSHATVEESKALAKQFKQFHVVITAGGPDEPPFEPEQIKDERGADTNHWLVETGRKGMYLNVIGLYGDGRPRRFQRVPIDSRFKDSPDIKKLLVDLQDKYKQHYLQFGWAGLGIKPLPHPSGRKFVGSERCADCHTTAHGIWHETPHAHATESLTKLDPPRQYDPECVSCHATGWEPQKYFPFISGYDSLKKTPLLHGNGCENCHGPGSRHVAIEEGEIDASRAQRLEARGQMRVTIAQAKRRVCSSCHDLDNSPDYVQKGFEAYWPKVEHKGKD